MSPVPVEADLAHQLFCGTPIEILEKLAIHFSRLSEHDLTNEPVTEAGLFRAHIDVWSQRTDDGRPPSSEDCPAQESFAAMSFVLANFFASSDGQNFAAESHSRVLNPDHDGGTGVGPSARALPLSYALASTRRSSAYFGVHAQMRRILDAIRNAVSTISAHTQASREVQISLPEGLSAAPRFDEADTVGSTGRATNSSDNDGGSSPRAASRTLETQDLPYDQDTRDQIRAYAERLETIGNGIDALSDYRLSRVSTAYGVSWWQVFGEMMAAEAVTTALRRGDVNHALLEIDRWVAKRLIAASTAGDAILPALNVAALAALPVEMSLESFVRAVDSRGYEYQRQAYFAARDADVPHSAIIRGEDLIISGAAIRFHGDGFFASYMIGDTNRLETGGYRGDRPTIRFNLSESFEEQIAAERDAFMALMRLEYEAQSMLADVRRTRSNVLDAWRGDFDR